MSASDQNISPVHEKKVLATTSLNSKDSSIESIEKLVMRGKPTLNKSLSQSSDIFVTPKKPPRPTKSLDKSYNTTSQIKKHKSFVSISDEERKYCSYSKIIKLTFAE